jgi:PKD repeat protein
MKLKRRRFGIYSLAALAMLLLLNIGCEKERLFEPEPELKSGSVERNEGDKYLIGFHATPDVNLVRGLGGEVTRTFTIVPAVAANLPPQAVTALEKNPIISYVEPDYVVYATAQTQTTPWGIDRVFGDEAYPFVTWSTTKGSGISVAIIDTGIDTDHQDLPSVAGGTNTVGGTSYEDGNGHGTHVAGTVAALDNTWGVVGVAPAVTLYAVKVLDDGGSGSVSSVVAGIEWAVNKGIKVLNMSLGSSSSSETLKSACDVAYDSGHLVVSSAGNSGNPGGKGNNVGYPAAYESVIAVAASTSNDTRASYSSTGPAVELIAPGSSILSTLPGNTYGTYSGTSMASPHVAGIAALAWASKTSLTNVQVRQILRETAEDLGLSAEHQGYGLARADLAVAAASGGTTPTNNPPSASFTFVTSELTVQFTDTSTDSDGTIQSRSWNFGDGATSTDQNPSHTYAADGTYTVTLTVTDDDGATNSASQSVTVSASTTNNPPSAGFSFTTNDLTATFSDQSTDSDGSVVAWNWDFGDGNTSTAQNPSHTFAAANTYNVTLTVTDNDGATGTVSKSVTVSTSQTSDISLTATLRKVRGVRYVDFVWSGATGTHVNIKMNGTVQETVENDGTHTINYGRLSGTFVFQVCETDDSACSNEVTLAL